MTFIFNVVLQCVLYVEHTLFIFVLCLERKTVMYKAQVILVPLARH